MSGLLGNPLRMKSDARQAHTFPFPESSKVREQNFAFIPPQNTSGISRFIICHAIDRAVYFTMWYDNVDAGIDELRKV